MTLTVFTISIYSAIAITLAVAAILVNRLEK